jgi:FKBP-type peptidyl-prolyl cis-trans isomerase
MKVSMILMAMSLFLITFSCTTESDVKKVAGYDVKYHDQNPVVDGRPETGDYVNFIMDVTSGGNSVIPEPMEQTMQVSQDESDPISAVLKTMSAGDSVSITVPMDSLPPEALENPEITEEGIQYHIALRSVVDEESYMLEENKKRAAQAEQKLAVDSLIDVYLEKYKEGTLEDLKETENGVEYVIIDEGMGDAIEEKDQISVHYVGRLLESGDEFDNSLERGQPLPLQVGVGAVIQGWDEGLQAFSRGDVGILFIPSEMGYGESGTGPIPANADLVFYVDIAE